MDKETKQFVRGFSIFGGIVSLICLLAKKAGAAPGRANLFGQVTNEQTGQPIEGIEVSLAGYAAVTQLNGHYLIKGIIPGEYEVTFHDPLGRYQTAVL